MQRSYLADIIEAVSAFVSSNSLEVGGDLVAIVDLLDAGVVRSETGDIYPGHIPSAAVAEHVGNLTARTVDALLSHDKPWNEVPAVRIARGSLAERQLRGQGHLPHMVAAQLYTHADPLPEYLLWGCTYKTGLSRKRNLRRICDCEQRC